MYFVVFTWLILCFNIVYCDILYKFEGSACTWRGYKGTCQLAHRCDTSTLNLKNKHFPPICSYQGRIPLICCTDCALVNDTRNIIKDPRFGVLERTGSRPEDKCFNYLQTYKYPCENPSSWSYQIKLTKKNCTYVYNSFKIEKQQEGTFMSPHVAYLGYGDNINTVQDWLCGGTVISDRFILTAAQCVNPDISSGPVRFVALGLQKRWVPSEWQKYIVKRAIVHPDYKPPSKYHDIALLETDKKIIFGPNVLPACLDTGNKAVNVNVRGTTWTAGESASLGYSKIFALDELQCSLFYPVQRSLSDGYNNMNQMCLGTFSKAEDNCEEEIGFPVQSDLKTCVQVVKGITSFKRVCGEAGGSGLYTRVSVYLSWIDSIVWPYLKTDNIK